MASNRIKVTGVLTGKYSFERPAYAGFGSMETVNIYKITGEDGKVYVWKTTGILSKTEYTDHETFISGWGYTWVDARGRNYYNNFITKGSKIVITASVKGESTYKGEQQTEIQRVKVEEIIFHAESEQERIERLEAEKEARKNELLESLKDGDRAIEMPYKQFKDHYADCETVPGSFRRDERNGDSYITIVVREGRMKNSGVRGQHFAGYEIEFTENGKVGFSTFRAVNEENAIKQAQKEFPEGTDFHCRKVYFHRGYHRIV